MSKPSQKKFEKQKKREKETKKQLTKRRDKIRSEAKARRELERLDRETQPKMQPYRKKVTTIPQTEEEIMAQVEHNLKILEALEEEYKEALRDREAVNEELEAEGFKTIQEKLDYLNKQAETGAKEAYEKRIKSAEKRVEKRKKAVEDTK